MASLIQQITSDPFQEQTIILPDGNSFLLQLYFMPMQYAWVITELVYGDFTLNGFRITNNPNMLQQYMNQIPFGLACISTSNREPTQQQDFSAGNSALYLLSAAEVAQYNTFLSKGAGT